VLQVYRVTVPFEAHQLDREPLRMESFGPGDLLIALSEESSSIVFCRRRESMDLSDCDRFIASAPEFEQYTESYDP